MSISEEVLESAEPARPSPFSLEYGDSDARIYARSIEDLAKCIGVSRRAITNWKSYADCPAASASGLYKIQEWKDFAKRHGLAENALEWKTPGTNSQLKEVKLRRELLAEEKAKLELEVMKGNFKSVEEISQTWNAAAAKLYALISEITMRELVSRGVDAVTANERGDEIANNVFKSFQENA